MSEFDLDDNYPGINRLQYFLGKAGMIAAVVFTVTVFGPESPVMKVVSLAVMVASVVLDVMRLRNIGVSQWFVFLRFLPFGGLILDLGLVSAQAGWAEERELDRSGKTILAFCLVLIAIMVFMWLRVGVTVPFYI